MAVVQYMGCSENYFIVLANIIVDAIGVFDGSGLTSAELVKKQLHQWSEVGLICDEKQGWAKEQCDKLSTFFNGTNNEHNIIIRENAGFTEYWIVNRSRWSGEFSIN